MDAKKRCVGFLHKRLIRKPCGFFSEGECRIGEYCYRLHDRDFLMRQRRARLYRNDADDKRPSSPHGIEGEHLANKDPQQWDNDPSMKMTLKEEENYTRAPNYVATDKKEDATKRENLELLLKEMKDMSTRIGNLEGRSNYTPVWPNVAQQPYSYLNYYGQNPETVGVQFLPQLSTISIKSKTKH